MSVAPLAAQEQEDKALHVFHKDRTYEILPINADTRIEFDSTPYIGESANGQIMPGDTVIMRGGMGVSDYLYLKSNRPIEVKTSADWLFAHTLINNNLSSQEEKLVRLWTKPNFTGKSRSAKVTVTAEGVSASYHVVQIADKFSFATDEYYNGGKWDGPTSLTENYEYDNYYYYSRDWLGKNEYTTNRVSIGVVPCYDVTLQSYPIWMDLNYFVTMDSQNDTTNYQALYEEVEKLSDKDPGRMLGSYSSYAGFTLTPHFGTSEKKGNVVFSNKDGETAVASVKHHAISMDKLYDNWYSYDWAGTNSINAHMIQGFRGVMMLSNMMSNDMSLYMSSDPWKYDHNIDYYGEQYIRSSGLWTFFYNIIGEANFIISSGVTAVDKTNVLPILAQCYALRGISYFYLAQFFQHTYATSQDEPCVPIVLSDYETSIYSRATVKQVFDQAEADLLNAEKMLEGWQRSSKNEINKEVVQGMLSRLYLVECEWAKAAEKARAARQNYTLMTFQEAYDANYQDIENCEVLWGQDVTTENTDFYASFQSWLCAQSTGYGGQVGAFQLIDAKLYNSIPASDVRKDLFYQVHTQYDSWTIPPYANKKFKQVNDFLGDVIYMRASELYLTEIEALIMAGKQAEADALFQQFIQNRNTSFDGNVTKAEIRKQRRIELWGEGFSYFDHRRWQMDLDRNYEGNNEAAGNEPQNIAWNEARWRFQLPKSAFGVVDDLTAEHQNNLEAQPQSLLLPMNQPDPEEVEPVRDMVYNFDFSSVASIESLFSSRHRLAASHESAESFMVGDMSKLVGEGFCGLVSSPFDSKVLFTQLSASLRTNSVHNIAGAKLDFDGMKHPQIEINAIQMQHFFGMKDYPGHFEVYVSENEITSVDELNAATYIGTSKENSAYNNYMESISEFPLLFDIPTKYHGKECYVYISNKSCYNSTDYDPNLGVLIIGMKIHYAK